ncbi:hypothetical protein JK636_18585 [Clostridium sp. YIM B02515]|uniref:Uncharacterized protein n=1 Tax=Clostridium rhizosphaerae TaxID=2803861 RepID=A0ABS1TG20_9CLOT|nr:hypothetical protein [Clostridium rhizosphaerae]MBL4937717.1 hypothetical protein [Clostridium rhizosphaerae]
MTKAFANLLLVVIIEFTLMVTGMALIPIITQSKCKRYININYIQPVFVLLGLVVLACYIKLG